MGPQILHRPHRTVALAIALLVAVSAWALRVSYSPQKPVRTTLRDPYAGSPYLNSRRDVKYVGDVECARCHEEIATAYRSHPMGRSLAPLQEGEVSPPIGDSGGLPFEFKGASYNIVGPPDGRTIHGVSRRDQDGSMFAGVEAEVRYALGSGTRGISYLIERDGFLFQSPIAWFAQQRKWDISPGYGTSDPRPNFERAIQRDCLFCHTNRVRSVSGTLNRYETPIFDSHAIGCERCHGPGELHVRRGGETTGPDLTIVNPARLSPALRESVCQQCHLQGWFRFPRAGQDSFDFRPGLPLDRFLAVFVRAERDPNRMDLIGQVEQMESSRCYIASSGKLGCISCHDPHRLPPPETKVAYYRERCLSCHEPGGCALPLAERQARSSADNCVACHMPRPAVADIPHTLTTDHRILRSSNRPEPWSPRTLDRTGIPLEFTPRDYFREARTEVQRGETERDMGIALELAAQELLASPELARVAAAHSIPLLEAAVRDRPDDLRARDSLGYALGMVGHLEEARAIYEGALRIEPNRELALTYLARSLAGLRRFDLADETFRQLVAVNPWRSDYRLAWARNCDQRGDWAGAASACREAIRLNPELAEARPLLIRGLLGSGEPDKAETEFQVLLRFHPASREVWEPWYREQKRALAGDSGHAPNVRP